jgi:pyruvate-formate lyase-activating enzyme
VEPLRKGEHKVKRLDKEVSVTVPVVPDLEDEEELAKESVRELMHIQALVAQGGSWTSA